MGAAFEVSDGRSLGVDAEILYRVAKFNARVRRGRWL